jgi:thiamine biosynthesis lipoprotein
MRNSGAGVSPATKQQGEDTGRRDACPTRVHRTRPAMGTLFEALLLGDDAEHLAAVADAVLDEVQRVERLLSRFDPRSEVSRINRLAASQPVQVDYELAHVLQTCFDAWRWTGGAFDIAATTPASGRRQPPDGVLSQRFSNIPVISFDPHQRQIHFDTSEIRLDLGAFGKGYALDRAAEILAEYSVENALLHGGTSSVLARGLDDRGQPWRVAIRDPVSGESAEMIELFNQALSCSAINEQADIVDPRTGRPLVGSNACAVIAPTAAEAEILSTAALCLGREKIGTLLAGRDDCQVYWQGYACSGGC